MTIFKLIALAGSMSMAATLASAADLRGGIDPAPLPHYEYTDEFAGGWYLRGDIGVANQKLRRLSNSEIEAPDRVPITKVHANFGPGMSAGAGVGYRFNNWLRMDATGEFRQAKLDALSSYPSGVGFTAGTFAFSAKKNAFVGLVNTYIDLGTWHGVTPFVGAGIGFAAINIHDFTLTNVQQGAVYYGGRGNRTNFAWALHAGAAIEVSDRLALELGYRYLNMGDAGHGAPLRDSISKGKIVDAPWMLRRMESHDIRVGMRWMLAEPTRVVQHWPEEPIVRKY
jgi:opacity protein-like surface antigen